MFFKRNEGFRFSFDDPIPASVVVLVDGKPVDIENTRHQCGILDISPRGMKVFSESDFGAHYNEKLQLEIHFVLDMTDIVGIGEIMWVKPFGRGKQYGIIFHEQPSVEDLIINELKSRRKKEVKKHKPSM
ncbi:PilZ domain-containing protein [Solibacillus sp. CAU 1738]|uniref:PilZ domain-containing protein n=1 Tax=Solibacillus sp. CAU 1738 TaxID=3140363 RepID=UPI0032614EA0